MNPAKEHKVSLVITPILFVTGILLFAVSHREPGKIFSVSYAGLLLAAVIIAFTIRKPRDLLTGFGLNAISPEKYHLFIAGLLTGVLFATIYRQYLGLPMIPSKLTFFAFTAAAIGFTEELLFRGFLQTRLRKINVFWSVVLATSSHTAYKVLLFAALSPVFEVNLLFLFFWTFVCGLVFGILKERSGSTLTPAAGHVAFDILVYGDRLLIPWWIWA
jgi:membrane protease YdiL (CAAX protease family)